ncbi:MAG: hypothetical protein QOI40_1468, partial [Alphaproteobacteria bacterium]|nr:hypothetical protein [Alphaproteobacteria bacterium]
MREAQAIGTLRVKEKAMAKATLTISSKNYS